VADGARKFSISLTTPDGAVFEDEAEMVIVPGAAGEIGVLARHAPLIALLKAGSTRIYTDRAAAEVHEFATGPGFFTVELDRAIALVDTAVNVREIDVGIAEALLEDARTELERLDRGESEVDRWQLEQRIKAAENQLAAAGRS
jgi:F-type H+-transporting ATPase subunit epsilon